MPRSSAARLVRAILLYFTLHVLVVTLAPFAFEGAPVHGLTTFWGLRDALLNVILFVPLGFVLQLSESDRTRPAIGRALALGFTLSAAIEVAQVFAPERYPSLSDLLTNTLGAALGAAGAAWGFRRADPSRAITIRVLDLPLVATLYLMVPLFWLAGLSLPGSGLPVLVLPLLASAWIVAAVHAAVAGDGRDSRGRLLAAAALFCAATLTPAAAREPAALLVGLPLFLLAVLAHSWAPEAWRWELRSDGERSRRFEAPTLRVAVVLIVSFLVVAALLPFDFTRPWRVGFPLAPDGSLLTDRLIFHAMALSATATVLGYAIAAIAGRRVERLADLAPTLLTWPTLLIVVLTIARGWRTGSQASGTLGLLQLAGLWLGAVFYYRQLAFVRGLKAAARHSAEIRAVHPPGRPPG